MDKLEEEEEQYIGQHANEQLLSVEQLKILKQYKDKKRLTASEFSLKVEQYVRQNKETYIDSIIFVSELYKIEFSKTATLLTENLKMKLAEEQNLLKDVYNVDSNLESCFD